MVSCEMRIRSSFGYRRLSQPAICSGDQFWLSLNATHSCKRRSTSILHGLGRRARDQAASSASAARYRCAPPLRATSRAIVDTDLPNRRARLCSDSLRLRLREISSRSDRVSEQRRRCRTGGEMPPLEATNPNTEPGGFASARAMSLSVCPARHRCQSSALSLGSKPRLRTCMRHHFFQPAV